MLAARFYDGDDSMTLEDVPEPEPAPDEALVDLRAASLCGSDHNYLTGKTTPGNTPITLGHEGAGVVTETGSEVTHLEVGDRVVVHYIRSCGNCEPCQEGFDNRCRNRRSVGHHVDGTFAESIAVPERSLCPLPGEIPFGWGSIAGCAVSTGYHAVARSGLSSGDIAVVFGVGGVGLHAVLWANHRGAATIVAVDPSDPQLEAAVAYGADVTLDPEHDDVLDRVAAVTDGWGADVALECSGSPAAMETAVDAVNGDNGYESGSVVSVGVQTEPVAVGFDDVREGQFRVSGDHTRAELTEIVRLLATGAVDIGDSITHRVALEEIHDGVALMDDPAERVGRIVVDTTNN